MHLGRLFGNHLGKDTAAAIFGEIQPDAPTLRKLSWTPTVSGAWFKVALDGFDYLPNPITDEFIEDFYDSARDHIEVWECALNTRFEDLADRHYSSPSDSVRLSWSEVAGSPVEYVLYYGLSTGNCDTELARFAAGQTAYSYTHRALADDEYFYKVVAIDAGGNEADSNEESQTIDGAPDPPTAIALSHNDGNGETTISWTAPGTGADHYHLYSGDPPDLLGAPTNVADTDEVIDNSALTGHVEYLVRAVDAGGQEEANLSQMVRLDASGGTAVSRPNSPAIADAYAAEGGEITVLADYDKRNEAGTAATVKMYVDDGAGGGVDWNTPVASASLVIGTDVERVSLTSSGLTGGLTYEVGVRALTAGGVQDPNTDTVEVTTDDAAPTAPTLASVIV